MTYIAAENRYESIPYRRVGRSGLVLPALSLGLWHNFGDSTPIDGPPYGSAEINFGRLLREDFKHYRDELIISSKAGWDMWPGPYGQGGGSRKYILASLDQSLQRLGVDYVDIFYSHRFDADTPLEETASALATAVQQGKALYIGISSYSGVKTREIAALLNEWKVPLLIHQPAYNLLNRWVEKDLLDTTEALGAGVIAFTPLAQGLLTDKYLNGVPADARVNRPGGGSLQAKHLSEANLAHVRALNEIAKRRGQSLAQLALAWTLRDPRVTSALIGASRPEQIIENVGALKNLSFTAEELAEIDRFALEGGINLWEKPSTAE
jgi:L-glyceraldehyde 3-phosphate reductase